MRTLRAVLPALLAALAGAARSATAAFGMPDALTDRGQTVERLYDVIATLGVLVFLIVFAWLVIVIWRFRETTGKGRATHEAERHNIKAELAWFLIPLVMVLFIGGSAYAGLVHLDEGVKPSDVAPEHVIHIIGSQWTWTAQYANGVTLASNPDATTGNVSDANVFYVPQDTDILFNITSSDVIHAFQVIDANRGYVVFNDANPEGASKYNSQVARFPAGEYQVQCNKMCLNPGHAYMRGRIKAVPEPVFQHWLNERGAAAGASIVQTLNLQPQGNQLVGPDGAPATVPQLVAGTRVVVNMTAPPQDVTLVAPDGTQKTIHRGETTDPFFAFTLDRAGSFLLTSSNGGAVNFTVIQAEVVTVTLQSYKLVPDHIDLQVGKTYLIQVPDPSTTVHDLQIGHYNGGGAAAQILWGSSPVQPGATGSFSFTVTPDQKGTFDMWCNQPGHHGLGMAGTVTIS